jgi:hypothetical protein
VAPEPDVEPPSSTLRGPPTRTEIKRRTAATEWRVRDLAPRGCSHGAGEAIGLSLSTTNVPISLTPLGPALAVCGALTGIR